MSKYTNLSGLFRKIGSARAILLPCLLAVGFCLNTIVLTSAESLVERYSKYDSTGSLIARGVVIANAEVTFSSALAAPVSHMPLKAGSAFLKGAILVEFDCGRSGAELRGAKASEGKQLLILTNKEKLKQHNAAGAFEVAEARADYQTAKAQSDAIKEVIKFCVIYAPFDGRVLELHVNTYEMPGSNAPLITVVDDSVLELDLIVPSIWLQWVSVGINFEFMVEETGQTYQAKVARLGAKVDAVSQTIKLSGHFDNRPKYVLPGMSGTARFNPPTQ
jgi:multidrug efflux pump subunit AcrA (membrane-fusion protein)